MAAEGPAQVEYKLVALNQDVAGQEFFVDGPIVSVGRQSESDVSLFWDPYVSRRHARLRREGADWLLEDLGSANGTYLGDQRVDGPAVLKPGDRIRIGHTWLEFQVEEPVAEPGPDQSESLGESAPTPSVWKRAISFLRRPAQAKPAPSDRSEGATFPAGADPVEPPAEGVPPVSQPATSQPPHHPERENDEAGEPGIRELAQADTPGATSTPSSYLSCTIFPLSVDIRARSRAPEMTARAEELRAALRGLEPTEHVVVKIVEALGDEDAWVSVSAPPGQQAALLICAGQVVDRLVRAGL